MTVLFIVVIFLSYLKVLRFLKIFSRYGFLVQLIRKTIIDVREFIAFFVLWILFFTVNQILAGAEYDLSEYKGLGRFLSFVVVVFRNSIGDIQIASYE